MPAELWMIAGPNGAGKTTLTQVEPLRNLISGVELLNPDVETLRRLNEQGIAGFATASSDTLGARCFRSPLTAIGPLVSDWL